MTDLTGLAARVEGDDAELFDDMLHALGRPTTELAVWTAYRNYYCCGKDSVEYARFCAAPLWWKFSHTINGGRDMICVVTDAGKEHVAAALRAKDMNDG